VKNISLSYSANLNTKTG